MRPLLLATSFPPAVGGMETLLYQTTRRMRHRPRVLAPTPAAAPDLEVWAVPTTPSTGVGRAAYRAGWWLHPSLHYLRTFLPAVAAAARRERPSAVLCGHAYLAPLCWLLARRLGVPYLALAYGQEVWRQGRRGGVDLLDRALRGQALRAATRVLVPGHFTAGLVRDWGVAESRIVRVPYGAEPRPPVGPPTERARVITVCRLVPRKGVDTLLRALPAIAERLPEVRYRVVGDGPDAPRLRRLAADLGLDRHVTFLGRVDDATLAEEYRACSLFALVSRRTAGELEGLGLVYFEAAAWGRASLAGRTGGESDAVVDGVTGCLVDGTSERAVANALLDLLADAPRLRTMGDAARQRVERTHNWACAAATVDAVLDGVA